MFPSITFLLTATLLAITPGPGIAYVVARTVVGGKTEGIASCIGTAVGVKILASRAQSTELPAIQRAGAGKALRDGI